MRLLHVKYGAYNANSGATYFFARFLCDLYSPAASSIFSAGNVQKYRGIEFRTRTTQRDCSNTCELIPRQARFAPLSRARHYVLSRVAVCDGFFFFFSFYFRFCAPGLCFVPLTTMHITPALSAFPLPSFGLCSTRADDSFPFEFKPRVEAAGNKTMQTGEGQRRE